MKTFTHACNFLHLFLITFAELLVVVSGVKFLSRISRYIGCIIEPPEKIIPKKNKKMEFENSKESLKNNLTPSTDIPIKAISQNYSFQKNFNHTNKWQNFSTLERPKNCQFSVWRWDWCQIVNRQFGSVKLRKIIPPWPQAEHLSPDTITDSWAEKAHILFLSLIIAKEFVKREETL